MGVADDLRRLEEELLTPACRRNASRLAELLDERFREFGSSGRVFTRPETIQALQDETPAPLSLQDFQAMPVGHDLMLVTYRTRRQVPGAANIQSLRSSLWSSASGRWRMLFHQGTRVP